MNCPICKKSIYNNKYRPFCSFKCKQIDLYNWLNENYKIPNENSINTKNNKERN